MQQRKWGIFVSITNRNAACRLCFALLFVVICINHPRTWAADLGNKGLLLDVNGIDMILRGMTLEEKVAQIFFITPDMLTNVSGTQIAGEMTKECFNTYPVGGLVYLEQNLISQAQITEMMENVQTISEDRLGLPLFLAVDEEGGAVSRLSGRGIEEVPIIKSMQEIGDTGNPENAYQIGKIIGSYLSEMGLNVDFAPVADVLSNPSNSVIGNRAFGSDAELVARMVAMEVNGLKDSGILATLKHFPGHGNTEEDSHEGYAHTYKTLDELREFEFIPFKSGIDVGADFVMVGHISLPNVLESDLPASLSKFFITDILQEELGFQGIIITDALNMGAIVKQYDSGSAAILALEAGVDMLLMPEDFYSAYNAVLNAVNEGKISETRLDVSLRKILNLKLSIK